MIKVGGSSEVEVGERKDRFVDALNATRAAVEEGIVPGGGVALLRASMVLEPMLEDKNLNQDIRTGIKIVAKACEEPCFLIAQNAGVEGAVIVQKVREAGGNNGYNAYEGKMVDMMAAGIIDPVKVVRIGLQVCPPPPPPTPLATRMLVTGRGRQDASSVATMMTTTEAMVVQLPDDKPGAPPSLSLTPSPPPLPAAHRTARAEVAGGVRAWSRGLIEHGSTSRNRARAAADLL